MHDCFKPLPELLAEYDRALAYTEDLWRDLDPDEVVWRPHQDSSAIGWHLGHQAHVAHFMVRNLTAAEPSPDPDLDGIMDSANPEQFRGRSEEHTSELQSRFDLVCRLLLEKKK